MSEHHEDSLGVEETMVVVECCECGQPMEISADHYEPGADYRHCGGRCEDATR